MELHYFTAPRMSSTDDPLLGEDVDDEDRGHGHQVAGEGHRVVGGELRAEDVLGERDGLVRLIGQNDQRQEEVVQAHSAVRMAMVR